MNIARFERLLAAYGPDTTLWPTADAGDAADFLSRSPAAALRVKQEAAFDAMMRKGLVFPDGTGTASARVIARAFGRIDGLAAAPLSRRRGLPSWLGQRLRVRRRSRRRQPARHGA
jgi:hypothetical protein